MKVLCNLITKKIESFSRRDEIPHDPNLCIAIDISYVPDMEQEMLNDTNDGLRAITQAEIDADIEMEKTIEASNLTNVKTAFIVFITILWENSAELRAAYATAADMASDAVARYRAEL